MPNLSALAVLLLSLGEAHRDLAELYAAVSIHLDPLAADTDVLALAKAIQGEEAGQFGKRRDELGTWIAHVAINRWDKAWWRQIDGLPCTFAARVVYDWHGAARIEDGDLQPWAVLIAYRELQERRNGGPDSANGALFAMTLEDLKAHGWEEGALQSLIHVIAAPDQPLVQFWMLNGDPAKPTRKERP